MRSAWWQWNPIRLVLIFTVFGLLAWGIAVVFPNARPMLFVLYWTFLFAAALLRFLTPERRIRATVSEHVFTELAANEAALVAAYRLQDTRVYVPRGRAKDPPARLFVPRHSEFELPDDELESPLVVSDIKERRGLSLLPSGGRLFREFESMLGGDLSGSPSELATQLADGVTEGLELADRVTPDVRRAEQRIDFEVTDGVYGPIDRFDHPVQSFLSVGLAVGLDRPVITTVATGSEAPESTITCRWLREQLSAEETVQGRNSDIRSGDHRMRTNKSAPEERTVTTVETNKTENTDS